MVGVPAKPVQCGGWAQTPCLSPVGWSYTKLRIRSAYCHDNHITLCLADLWGHDTGHVWHAKLVHTHTHIPRQACAVWWVTPDTWPCLSPVLPFHIHRSAVHTQPVCGSLCRVQHRATCNMLYGWAMPIILSASWISNTIWLVYLN